MTGHLLAPELADWLDAHAGELDAGGAAHADVVPRLSRAGLFQLGVPTSLGGAGGTIADAVAALAAVAERSLTAAFVFWGQRTFVEYLLHSPNAALRQRLLPSLLDGTLAGATGLSNAIKHLSGLETLQIGARADARDPDRTRLTGQLAWVTNLRPDGFVVAVAVAHDDGERASIYAVPSDAAGVARSADLDLIALRGSDTAALALENVAVGRDVELHPDAHAFLAAVRPAFLALQCAMSIGLARRSLDEAARAAGSARAILAAEVDEARGSLEEAAARMIEGVVDGTYRRDPAALFAIRIELASIAQRAVFLELQASGGRGYLRDAGLGFERRWREAAFLPVVTPSLVQLKHELARRAGREAA